MTASHLSRRAFMNGSGPAHPVSFEQPLTAVQVKLEIATPADAALLASLHAATSKKLTDTHGIGPWSGKISEKSVLMAMRNARVYVARDKDQLIATLTLGTKKPWAIDRKYFSQCHRPLYLTSMAVVPELQRQGVGRLCIDAIKNIAKQWPADAIFLDAYDTAAGAGGFYGKCGFREVGRASYRGAPLVYFEMFV
jgi:GNAT superfamily N-acetyltransferase